VALVTCCEGGRKLAGRVTVVISFAKSRRISVTVNGMSPGSVARRRSFAAMAVRIAAASMTKVV
jgi:hypothetical protein